MVSSWRTKCMPAAALLVLACAHAQAQDAGTGPVACTLDGQDYPRQYDIWRSNGAASSALECAQRCQATQGCTMAAYLPERGVCFPKKVPATDRPDTTEVSHVNLVVPTGSPVPCPPTVGLGCTLSGQDYPRMFDITGANGAAATALECAQLCQATPECTMAAYLPGRGACFPKKVPTTDRPKTTERAFVDLVTFEGSPVTCPPIVTESLYGETCANGETCAAGLVCEDSVCVADLVGAACDVYTGCAEDLLCSTDDVCVSNVDECTSTDTAAEECDFTLYACESLVCRVDDRGIKKCGSGALPDGGPCLDWFEQTCEATCADGVCTGIPCGNGGAYRDECDGSDDQSCGPGLACTEGRCLTDAAGDACDSAFGCAAGLKCEGGVREEVCVSAGGVGCTLTGQDYPRVYDIAGANRKVSSALECAQLCQATPECTMAAYVPSRGVCFPKKVPVDRPATTKRSLVNLVTFIGSPVDCGIVPGCEVTTTTEKMNIYGPALQTVRDSGNAAECFKLCQEWDEDDTKCSATVHRPSNGDCYLHSKTIDDAKPAGARVYVTYCAK